MESFLFPIPCHLLYTCSEWGNKNGSFKDFINIIFLKPKRWIFRHYKNDKLISQVVKCDEVLGGGHGYLFYRLNKFTSPVGPMFTT